jgi:signal transduction histidine kinase
MVIHQGGTLKVLFINEASGVIKQLAYDRSLPVYRVLQELFTNTIRHAGARSVRLSFLVEGRFLVCQYTDDGIGLKPGKGGMGMRNIESRLGMIGATYQLAGGNDKGGNDKGFGIKISIPIA